MEILILFLVASCVFAYFIGSIPFGLILAKQYGYGDIREIGSGNIGATNVLRTGNKKLALATFILDGTKGVLAIVTVLSTATFTLDTPAIDGTTDILFTTACAVGFFAILGHCFPIGLKFKGGKGVATAIGTLLAAVPFAGFAACLAWIITAKITKFSSFAALVAVAVAPVVAFVVYGGRPAAVCALITLLVWVRHKDNIARLRKGEEPKIGAKKKDKDAKSVSSDK